MNLLDLTPQQLRRAAFLEERIESLKQGAFQNPRRNSQLCGAVQGITEPSARVRKEKLQPLKPATLPIKAAATARKETMSPAARSKLSLN